MIPWIQQTAAVWSEYALWMVTQNTIFLLLILGLLRLLQNSSANLKYWIGILALIKCILPPFLPAPFLTEGFISKGTVQLQNPRLVQVMDHETQVPSLNTTEILFLAWICIFLLTAVLPLINTVRLKLQLKNSNPVTSPHGTGSVPVRMSDRILVPMTLGIFKPCIYVPEHWKTWSPECKSFILKHEIAHIRRLDAWFQLLQMTVQAAYAFHPLVWLLNRRLDEYREMACDDASVGPERSMSVEYSRALVQIAEDLKHSQLGYASASALIRQRNELLNRIQYQMEEPMKFISRWKKVALIGFLLVLFVPFSWTRNSVKKEAISSNLENTGTVIQGYTKTKSGNILSDIKVLIEGTDFTSISDKDGFFKMTGIPKGDYNIVFMNGRKKVGQMPLEISSSDVWTCNMTLNPNGFVDLSNVQPVPSESLGKIYGTITDTETGLPLAGANVIVEGTQFGAATDEEGNYVIPNLKPGKYNLNVSMMGYGSVGIRDVEVRQAVSTKTPMKLKPQIIAFSTIQAQVEKEEERLNAPPPPPIRETEEIEFVKYDSPPLPVGGFKAIQKHLVYPESERKAGTEGKVVVFIHINESGQVDRYKIEESLNDACDKAAIDALKAVQWTPAMQRDKPIAVWIAVPVEFALN